MKRGIIGFTMMLAFANSAVSQVRIGPMVGVNISTINEGSGTGSVVITAISTATLPKFGLLLDISTSDRIGIQTGLNVSGYGADYKLYNTNYGNSVNMESRLYYLGLPVDVYVRPLLDKPTFSILGGLEFNGLTVATTNGESDRGSYGKFDLQVKIGAQAKLSGGFGTKIQYGIGTKNIFDESSDGKYVTPGYQTPTFDNKTRSFSISIFYLFGGGIM